MLTITLLAIIATLVGGLLGLLRLSVERMNPLRVFALISVAAIVLLHLLPEAILGGGALVLVAFAIAFAAPALWPRFSRARGRQPKADGRLTLEVAYISLLVHKLSDGIALGVVINQAGGLDGYWGFAVGLLAHTIPMAAIVAVGFRPRGPAHVALRLVGLAGAIVAGAALTEVLTSPAFAAGKPYFDATAAGLLLHIVFHDLQRAPNRSFWLRAAELVAVGAGVFVAALAVAGHAGHAHVEGDVLESLASLSVDLAPMLLAGLVLGALIQTFAGPLPVAWLEGKTSLGAAARGAVVGAPLPLSSCGILPVTVALSERGVMPAAAVAFLLATPELGAETFLVTGHLFGLPWALVRLLGAVAVAIVAGLVIGRLTRRTQPAVKPPAPPASPKIPALQRGVMRARPTLAAAGKTGVTIRRVHSAPSAAMHGPCGPDHLAVLSPATEPRPQRFVRALFDLVEHVGPWMLVGLIAAAYVDALLPASFLADLPTGLDILIVTAVAIPGHVRASSAVPLAAVLVAKGLSPGAALVGLLLGPATNMATVGFLKRRFGLKATLWALAGITALVWALAALMNAGLLPEGAHGVGGHIDHVRGAAAAHGHGAEHAPWLSLLPLFGLAFLMAGSFWRTGVGTWLEALHGHHDHGHPHTHAHDALDDLAVPLVTPRG